MRSNAHAWDLRTDVHLQSDFYDVASFKQGRNSLRQLEQEELGDVQDKSLLHLQCHFGMDTLSWARLGAKVTGVDFSEKAIDAAQSLAKEVGLEARFIRANLYDLPDLPDLGHEQFDIVIATYGVLSWLPDLDRWAKVVAHFLKPGGTFCLVEIHPNWGFIDEVDGRLMVTDSVFRSEPWETETTETYADGAALPKHIEYNWPWTVGRLVTVLINAGLRIERLRELPFDVRQRVPSMVRSTDGFWHVPGDPFPIMVTCAATQPQ
jgi:2-polyprenyl-3-methyl-5-hydroxy-6-metoxy-1,4-benzoquinol methylase